MTVQRIPADLFVSARYQLLHQPGHDAVSVDGYALEAVLGQLQALAMPGVPAPTKASLAEAIDQARHIARAARTDEVCWCGHPYAEHLGHAGCLECDVCFGAAPAPVRPAPVARRVGDEVTVINRCSRYFAVTGLAVARDEDGLKVRLDGAGECLHFEQSELGASSRRRVFRAVQTRGK